MSTKPPQTHLSCWLSTCKHCNVEHASVNSLNTHRQPEHQYSLYKCIYYNIMHLYHISNSSSMYCSSNPRFSFSCSSCISSGGPSGCGWCLGTHSCHTREGCEVKFWIFLLLYLIRIVQGDWVTPGGVCLHDAFYSCIILIIILVIILIIILLLFLIFYIMDGCLRNINQNQRKRMQKSLKCGKENSHKNKVNSPEEDSFQSKCCCSDESYIYGQDLSLGNSEK